jgi:ppGpp synthetase/RelA/SpoT-type nucleotidyltranferase
MKSNNFHIQQSKDELLNLYKSFNPIFVQILQQMEILLKNVVIIQSVPTFKTRIKTFDSYYKKVIRVQPEALKKKDFPVLSDILGIRIICPFLDDIDIVEKELAAKFTVLEIERKGAERSFSEFGYESIHILIELPEVILKSFPKNRVPKGLICEIQVRTILQDAWAEVEHELVYKSAFSPFDLPLRRKLASMNASLSLADIVFEEIRDYQRKLNQEVALRRENFYRQADVLSKEKLNAETEINGEVTAYKNISSSSPYVRGTIDDLLLDAIHAQNAGENEHAIEIYTIIINSKPIPSKIVLSVIHKHRGMAYFAMHNYKVSIEDFTKSIQYDPKNYHSLYYKGIVMSVINNEKGALDCFDRSLEINPYQAHVNYRRAMSLYRLGKNNEAIKAIDEANRLGLDDDDSRKLRILAENAIGINN